MEFFEKLSKKASETYKTAAEKTNKIASDTKLKIKISENKSRIDDLYTQIGQKIYQKYVVNTNLDIEDDIKEDLEKIKQLTDEIEEYEIQRLELSDMKQCINCKNTIEKSAKFCPNCGVEQPVEEIQVEVVLEEDSKEEGTDTDNSSESSSNNENTENY